MRQSYSTTHLPLPVKLVSKSHNIFMLISNNLAHKKLKSNTSLLTSIPFPQQPVQSQASHPFLRRKNDAIFITYYLLHRQNFEAYFYIDHTCIRM